MQVSLCKILGWKSTWMENCRDRKIAVTENGQDRKPEEWKIAGEENRQGIKPTGRKTTWMENHHEGRSSRKKVIGIKPSHNGKLCTIGHSKTRSEWRK